MTWLEPEKFLVIASDVIHRRIEPMIRRAARPGEVVTVADVTSGTTLLSVQGPASRELIGLLTDADLGNSAFPYLSARQIYVGYAPVLAIRVTYVGELGWELHVPAEYATGVFDDLMAAGRDLGFGPVGLAAMTSLRLEKGYRDFGVDIDSTDNPVGAGLGFAVAWDKPGGFTGRDALLAVRAAGPPRDRLVGLLVDDPDVDLFGNEPVLADGAGRATCAPPPTGTRSAAPWAWRRSAARRESPRSGSPDRSSGSGPAPVTCPPGCSSPRSTTRRPGRILA